MRSCLVLTEPASGLMRITHACPCCLMSLPRSWVISPGRDPVYAQIHGTHRRAASNSVLGLLPKADAAFKIVLISSALNALFSRVLAFLCRVTGGVSNLNGLLPTLRRATAQLKTVRAALHHTSITVSALRSSVTSCSTQANASSPLIEPGSRPLK